MPKKLLLWILLAKDKELNRWCSLKKAIQYRPEHVEKYDVIAFDKKGKNENLKKKYLPSLFTEKEADKTVPSTSSTHAINRKENKQTENIAELSNATDSIELDEKEVELNTSIKKKKGNKGRKQNKGSSIPVNDGDSNLKSNKDQISSADSVIENNQKKNSDNSSSNTLQKKKKNKNMVVNNSQSSFSNKLVNTQSRKRKVNNNNKRNSKKLKTEEIGISDARLAAYGFNPKKFKNKLKYGNL